MSLFAPADTRPVHVALMETTELTSTQKEVYQTLGHGLVQVQLFERQMKRLLALKCIGGTIEEIENQLSSRHLDYKTNTLGTLVKEFLSAYVFPDGTELPSAPEPRQITKPTFHFRVGINMPEDSLVDLSLSLARLVTYRNDVVHHLAEMFQLGSGDGCQQALVYLKEFASCLELHNKQLNELATHHDKVKLEAASFMQTPVFLDMLLDGINPDGSVDWLVAGIVQALNQASQVLSVKGWARLADSINWIRVNAPTQIPSRYRCGSYRHVLHESKSFDVERRLDTGGRVEVWYRARNIRDGAQEFT